MAQANLRTRIIEVRNIQNISKHRPPHGWIQNISKPISEYHIWIYLAGMNDWTSINPSYDLGFTNDTRVLTHPQLFASTTERKSRTLTPSYAIWEFFRWPWAKERRTPVPFDEKQRIADETPWDKFAELFWICLKFLRILYVQFYDIYLIFYVFLQNDQNVNHMFHDLQWFDKGRMRRASAQWSFWVATGSW